MASDLRWTGGPANREWCAGQRAGRVIDPERITRDVKRYLTDCQRFRLDLKYHPTEASCLKVVYYAGTREADAIRAEYQRQTATRLEAVPSG